MTGAALAPDDAEAMSYIGPKGLANLLGETQAKGLLAKAESMFAKGASNEEVRQSTGIFKGMDGKPRFELDDTPSMFRGYTPPENPFTPSQQKRFDTLNRKKWGQGLVLPKKDSDWLKGKEAIYQEWNRAQNPPTNLGAYLEHPELMQAYPDLAKVGLYRNQGGRMAGALGSYTPEIDAISLSGDKDLGTLLHEVQHAIQNREGFASGGTPSEFAWASSEQRPELLKEANRIFSEWKPASFEEFWGSAPVTPDAESKYAKYLADFNSRAGADERWRAAQSGAPMGVYKKLAGEIEARDVTNRHMLGLGPEERRAIPPDLQPEAIVRYNIDPPGDRKKALAALLGGGGVAAAASAPDYAEASARGVYPSFTAAPDDLQSAGHYTDFQRKMMQDRANSQALVEAWNPVESLAVGGLGAKSVLGVLANVLGDLGLYAATSR
jgi:hypothetical protein